MFLFWITRTNKDGECNVWPIIASTQEKALQIIENKRPLSSMPQYDETVVVSKIPIEDGVVCAEMILHDHYFNFFQYYPGCTPD